MRSLCLILWFCCILTWPQWWLVFCWSVNMLRDKYKMGFNQGLYAFGLEVGLFLLSSYEAQTHQFDSVSACSTEVRHWHTLDTTMISVRHAILCVKFKKYYFLTRTRIRQCWMWLRYHMDTARIRSGYGLVLFFPIIWWTKKEFKGVKIQVHSRIFFEMSIKIVPHVFWKEYRKYTWHILRLLHVFWKGFRK